MKRRTLRVPGPFRNEAEFTARLIVWMRWAGWLVYHTHDSRRSEPGFPDLILVRGRIVVALELKMPGCKPTPKQQAWLTALERTGIEAWCACPDDHAEIAAALGLPPDWHLLKPPARPESAPLAGDQGRGTVPVGGDDETALREAGYSEGAIAAAKRARAARQTAAAGR